MGPLGNKDLTEALLSRLRHQCRQFTSTLLPCASPKPDRNGIQDTPKSARRTERSPLGFSSVVP